MSDHTEMNSVDHFFRLLELDPLSDPEKVQLCLEAFLAAGIDLSTRIINGKPNQKT
jgi:hypothetical protein